ncbi:MAG TPA: hypothetical protein VFY45_25170, partial [Baekduia sp.]|nr:hypothetical protein [Baekduia sp.]
MASPPPAPPADRGIDLTTLFLSAVASAAAAYITSKIWAPGTLFSAAMSPVIVALVKEGLRKPTEVVANVVPTVVPTPTRWSRASADEPGLVVDGTPEPEPHVDPDAPHVVLPPVVAAETGPVHVYSTRGRRLRWRLAVITGLLGFAICVVLYTVPELISGKSIGRGGDATTLWGGHRNHTKKSTTTQTTTTTTPTSTATTPRTTDETKTVTQTQTVTTPTPTTTQAT